MTPRVVAASLCLLAMCAAGCDLAVGLGRGIADAVFMFLLVVASIIGLAGGGGLAVALSARGRLGVAHVLFASVAGFGVAAFLFSTNDGLHVRPTFAFHAIAGRIELPGRARWLAISASASCAELESGEAWCWGAASEEAGVIHGERCSGGLFGPWRICASKPMRMNLPKTAIPFEALKPK